MLCLFEIQVLPFLESNSLTLGFTGQPALYNLKPQTVKIQGRIHLPKMYYLWSMFMKMTENPLNFFFIYNLQSAQRANNSRCCQLKKLKYKRLKH